MDYRNSTASDRPRRTAIAAARRAPLTEDRYLALLTALLPAAAILLAAGAIMSRLLAA